MVSLLDSGSGSGTVWEDREGKLSLVLEPYEARVWRFHGAEANVEYVYSSPAESAKAEVEERLTGYRLRDRTIHRPAELIDNPSFESLGGFGQLHGWNVVEGEAVPVATDPKDGRYSISLKSEDGAAELVSNLFPAPRTGQLAVSLFVQPIDLDSASKIRIAFEQEGGGYRAQTTVPAESLSTADATGWRELVFAADDLPLVDGPPLRLRLSIEGAGALLLDDVRTETLKLPLESYADDLRAEKLALVRLQRDAELAFEEERLDDCREILDGYWARFVMEYFPLKEEAAVSPFPSEPATPEESASLDEEEPEVADRWRRYLPSFLR